VEKAGRERGGRKNRKRGGKGREGRKGGKREEEAGRGGEKLRRRQAEGTREALGRTERALVTTNCLVRAGKERPKKYLGHDLGLSWPRDVIVHVHDHSIPEVLFPVGGP